MNGRIKKTIEPRYVLLLCTVLMVVLMFTSYKFPAVYAPFRAGIMNFMTPVQKSINMVSNSVNEFTDDFDDVDELQKENETLRNEYNELKSKYDALLADSYELENLRALFELSESYSEYETVGANIIAGDPSGYNSVFTIDKGEKDGIDEDMNVIAGKGLVGIVTEVGEDYATVRSIVDANSNVIATVLQSSDSCMVTGSPELLVEGYIKVSEIPLGSETKNNYQVVTSDISSKYLPGILIGYVSNLNVSADGLSMEGYLTPAVDFSHLETVLVVTTLKTGKAD